MRRGYPCCGDDTVIAGPEERVDEDVEGAQRDRPGVRMEMQAIANALPPAPSDRNEVEQERPVGVHGGQLVEPLKHPDNEPGLSYLVKVCRPLPMWSTTRRSSRQLLQDANCKVWPRLRDPGIVRTSAWMPRPAVFISI